MEFILLSAHHSLSLLETGDQEVRTPSALATVPGHTRAAYCRCVAEVKCSQIITWTPLLQILPQTNTATMQT